MIIFKVQRHFSSYSHSTCLIFIFPAFCSPHEKQKKTKTTNYAANLHAYFDSVTEQMQQTYKMKQTGKSSTWCIPFPEEMFAKLLTLGISAEMQKILKSSKYLYVDNVIVLMHCLFHPTKKQDFKNRSYLTVWPFHW